MTISYKIKIFFSKNLIFNPKIYQTESSFIHCGSIQSPRQPLFIPGIISLHITPEKSSITLYI